MADFFDTQVLSTSIVNVVKDTFDKMAHVKMTAEPVIAERDIIEYDGNMRLFPMEKFNGPCFISYVNFYLSPTDLTAHRRAVGTFVVYIKEDIIEKVLKAFGRSIKDAEHEEVVLSICGELCNLLAGNLKNDLAQAKYVDFFISEPSNFKNHVSAGAPFDYNLYTKQECIFSFWGQKCIVIEACIGRIPSKGS
jgi:hypothetical protein